MINQGLVSFLVIGSTGVSGIFLSEYLRRKRYITNETARKSVHMLHAGAITLWGYFLHTYTPIILAELGTLLLVVIAHHYKLFRGFSRVGRVSYGDLLLPASIIIVTILGPTYPQFVVIMAHVGVADALAAVAGKRVCSPRYRQFGQVKTLAGSLTFLLISVTIFTAYLMFGPGLYLSSMVAIGLASVIVTLTEAAGLYGADNLTIPLVTYAILAVGLIS